MHSIPAAMTWEILVRGKWNLPAMALGAFALPAIILLALESDGAIDAQSQSMIVLHIVIVYINAFAFVAGIFTLHRRMSQYYPYPVRTSTIVAWRLLPTMTLAALQVALCIAVFNVSFDLDWPIWGPAMFVAVAFAAIAAAFWLTENSAGWMIAAISLIAAVFGLWFKSRYGATFGDPSRYWRQISPAEFFTMLGMAAAAYCVAVVAVARNRRGEAPLSAGIVDRINRNLDLPASRSRWLDSPMRAQLWLEWRRKGWVMPFIALLFLVFGLIPWIFASRNAYDLFLGLASSGVVIWFISFLGGLVLGNVSTNPNEGGFIMGQHLATRPMTDAQMAQALLRTAATSLLATWLIWIVAMLVMGAILLALGAGDAIQFPPGYTWWSFPGMLLSGWIIVGVMASIGLTGSERLFQAVTGLTVALLILPLFSKLVLSQESQQLFFRAVVSAIAGAVVLGTIWVYSSALRRALIQAPTAWAAAGVWIVATAAFAFVRPLSAGSYWFACLLAAAAFALALAPLASAPLALSWNRHR